MNLRIELLPPLLSLVTGIFLALAAYLQAPQAATNRLFSLVSIFWALLAPAFLAHGLLQEEQQILMVERAIHCLYVFLPPVNLVFFHHLLGLRRPRLTLAAWFLSGLLALSVPTPWYIAGIRRYSWGSIALGGPAFHLFGAYSAASTLYFFAIFVAGIRRQPERSTRRRLGIILAAFGLMALLTLLNLPAINGIDLYPAGNFAFLPLGLLAFGLLRHRLLDLRDSVQQGASWLLPIGVGALVNYILFVALHVHVSRLAPLPQFLLLLAWFHLNLLAVYKTRPLVDRVFRPARTYLNQRRLRFMDHLAQLRSLGDLEQALSEEIGAALGYRQRRLYVRREDGTAFVAPGQPPLQPSGDLASRLAQGGVLVREPETERSADGQGAAASAAALCRQSDAEVVLPLAREGRLLALLTLTRREGGAPPSAEERRYLETLAAAGGVALANSLLYHRVARLNERLEAQAQALKQEIVEREETQRALQRSEQRFRLLAENTLDVIWVMNPETRRLVFASPSIERLTGWRADEALRLDLADLLTPEALALAEGKLQRTGPAAGGSLELELRRRDGSTLWTETITAPLRDPHLPATGILGVTRDISERRARLAAEQAEFAAAKANRAKSEFLANMSHELRTPLNHIIGFTELVVDRHFGALNETQAEYLDDVLHSSRHLLELINDILDLSKVEAGRMELNAAPFPLRPLLENSLTMVKEKSLKHGIRLSLAADALPASLAADQRKLKQVLYNLLSNAIKFTPDGGSVTLEAGVRQAPNGVPGLLEFAVRDTGIGLKACDLERIFNTFEQVDGSAARRYEGTGLGLSLSRRLVELHGGRIWAESAGEGRGSRFVFTLPLPPEVCRASDGCMAGGRCAPFPGGAPESRTA